MPKNRDRRKPVSVVTARAPATISPMRRCGTRISLASRYWVMPMGFRNSSSRISPGCGYGTLRMRFSPSVVVHDLNILRAFRRPHEAHAELVVDTNAVLTGTAALQRFQPIARRHAQVIKFPGPVQHRKLAHGHRF